MKNYFILFLFLFSNIFLFAQSFTTIPGTDGLSKATAYQLWTKEHWLELRDSVNNSMYPNYSTWHFGKHFRLMNNIKDTIIGIEVIVATFRGYFHGGGKKITLDLLNNNPYSNLFPFANLQYGCSIDSLIVDGYIIGNSSAAGIVGGSGINDIVSHCVNNAIIISYSSNNGGIIAGSQSTIINCINNGDITGVDRVAGIASGNLATITNCINTGKITVTNSGSSPYDNGSYCIGGIAAYHKNNISNCINLGTVEGQNNVGGIVGWAAASQITNCVNYGYIKGTNAVGGILGYMYNQSVNISNCVNIGVVEGESDV